MNRIIFFTLVLIFCSSLSYASKLDCGDLNKTSYHREHAHCYTDKDTDTDTNTTHGSELGVGTDVVLWVNESDEPFVEEVLVEYRNDIKHNNHNVYGVVRINLWDKLKGLFSKGE